ncbi:MAG: YceI family protein [Porticoccaceae bacterium]
MIKGNKVVLCALVLSSCTKPIPELEAPVLPDQFPVDRYTMSSSAPVFKVDPQRSEVLVTVRRGGLMAKLGHDHIVSSGQLQGFILMDRDNQRCHAEFYFPLHSMEVDNPQLRAQAGMQTTPSDKDINGTRINMLRSLEAKQFPFVQLRSDNCSEAFSNSSVLVDIQLHGETQQQQIELQWHRDGTGILTAHSTFSILQTDFNIAPFSVMNGLIKVEDRLEVDVRLVANPLNTTKQ